MMVIDFDIYGSYYIDGIATSFYYLNKDRKIDAIGANGIDLISRYYDPFALTELNENNEYLTLKEK